MATPKVSVIMPAYNHEKFIGATIESVLSQSFNDFEFIIINDGSTDRTDEVVKRYKDDRIQYYVQENIDAFNTLNKGISIAKGKYISIINSDDLYHQERLSYLVDFIEKGSSVFVTTNVGFIDELSVPIVDASNVFVTWLDRLQSFYKQSKSLPQTFLLGNIAVTSSNFFFLSDIIKEIGVFKKYRYSHDYDFALRAVLKYGDLFSFLMDREYLYYRIHNRNTISSNIIDVNKDGLKILLSVIPELVTDETNKKNAEVLMESIEYIHSFLFSRLDNFENINKSHSRKIIAHLLKSSGFLKNISRNIRSALGKY